ncbi:hypothetical protein BV25DRAFT_1911148 [Artomyces pyxidatus]|uniref:Uncharacterized protein n=1 Tax=Artomyces pyxidatus TaxID=48021 RepID=A0ACB8TI96_9AGAM|nr:hypothetical protein BV25DRAFT_1911148 [Artomyces pyxidatus]
MIHMPLAVAARRPALLLFFGLESLLLAGVWHQYRQSPRILARHQSHIPSAKFFG